MVPWTISHQLPDLVPYCRLHYHLRFVSQQHFTRLAFILKWYGLEWKHPRTLEALATYIKQPAFPHIFRKFLHTQHHPNSQAELDETAQFDGTFRVFHSAIVRYYAPSDLCGAGGMHREHIRSTPMWHGDAARHDTVFVSLDEFKPGMEGMLAAHVLLFFSFYDPDFNKNTPCALVDWFFL